VKGTVIHQEKTANLQMGLKAQILICEL
jgi:hypothetical protein